jgi:hypothetical protein
VTDFVARAGAGGFTLQEVAEVLFDRYPNLGTRR